MLNNLILDIKIEIGKIDEDVWYQLYLYDDEFKKYSKSELGIKVFRLTFTKCLQQGNFIEYQLLGRLHRDGDLPARIWSNGDQVWYQNGQRHRDNDLPARIWSNGTQTWWKNGTYHRDGDLPAIMQINGYHAWYQNGNFIRSDNINKK